MASDIGSIEDLIAERGTIRGRGLVVEPQEDGAVTQTHHVSTLTYQDSDGHWHAVLIDTVDSGPIPGSPGPATIEILSDVIIL
jgi:hypothetical protein